MSTTTILLVALVLVAALLYSTVGHAGASGYLAAMALMGVAPEVMRPIALTLNVAVALIATFKFFRAGCFSWSLFWPFAIASVPAAYVGGRLSLPSDAYKVIVGLVLLYAAVRMVMSSTRREPATVTPPPRWAALLCGAAIGVVSGLTGVGGGIFLSPLLLILGWSRTREAAGVAAPFILVNSIAALVGSIASLRLAGPMLIALLPAAIIGGWVGADYGSKRLATPLLRQLLAAVLVVAGLKLILA